MCWLLLEFGHMSRVDPHVCLCVFVCLYCRQNRHAPFVNLVNVVIHIIEDRLNDIHRLFFRIIMYGLLFVRLSISVTGSRNRTVLLFGILELYFPQSSSFQSTK